MRIQRIINNFVPLGHFSERNFGRMSCFIYLTKLIVFIDLKEEK